MAIVAVLEVEDDSATLDSSSRITRLALIGLVGAVVMIVGFGALHALQQPPFVAPDETAHVGYAHEIASFRLPEISMSPEVPAAAVQWRAERESARDDRYRGVWVANHPPLFYVATAPLIWASERSDAADGGLVLIRLASVGFAAVGVAFTFLLARELSDGNTRIALVAATLAGLIPQGHAVFSEGLNDGLGFAAGTAVVWAGMRLIDDADHTPTRSALVVLSACVAVAWGSRASTMLLAVVVVAVVSLFRLSRPGMTRSSRLHESGRIAAVALLPAVVLFGWFYVRNIALYGDLGASRYLLERFQRQRVGSVFEMFTQGHMWADVYQGLLSPSTLSRRHPPGTMFVSAIATIGLVVTAATGRIGWGRTSPSAARILRWKLLLCVASAGVVATTIAQHASGGGNWYSRYGLPVLGVIATLVVVGVEKIVPRVGSLVLVGLVAWWAVLGIPTDIDPTTILRPRDRGQRAPIELQVLPWGDGWRNAAGVLIVIGLAVALVSLATMSAMRRDPRGQGRA